MINLTGVSIIRVILKNALITDTSEFLVKSTDFAQAVRHFLKYGEIAELVDLSIDLDCYTGHPDFIVHDKQIPQYLTVKY